MKVLEALESWNVFSYLKKFVKVADLMVSICEWIASGRYRLGSPVFIALARIIMVPGSDSSLEYNQMRSSPATNFQLLIGIFKFCIKINMYTALQWNFTRIGLYKTLNKELWYTKFYYTDFSTGVMTIDMNSFRYTSRLLYSYYTT